MATTPCPNCGGPAPLQPGVTQMQCPYCGTSFSVGAPPPVQPPAWGPPPSQQQSAFVPQATPFIVVPPGDAFDTFARVGTTSATLFGLRLIVPIFVALAIAGAVGFSTWQSSTGMAGSRSGFGGIGGWNGSSPMMCGGNDQVTVSGVRAVLGSGSVVTVGGNCHFTCNGCDLEGPLVVSAGGNAEVDLVDTMVKGAQAVVAGGNAQVRITGGSKVTGQVIQGGNASVSVPPGSQTSAPGTTPAPPAATTHPPPPQTVVTSSPSHAAPAHAPSSHH